jgi:hypothetical protein
MYYHGASFGGFCCSLFVKSRNQIPFVTLLACFDKTLNFRILSVLDNFQTLPSVCNVNWLLMQTSNLKSLKHFYYDEDVNFILPQKLTKLACTWYKCKSGCADLKILPKTITDLRIFCCGNMEINNFPPNLLKLRTDFYADKVFMERLPQTLTYLKVQNLKYWLHMLPQHITHIDFDDLCDEDLSKITFPDLLFMKFTTEDLENSDKLTLPTNLTHLKIVVGCTKILENIFYLRQLVYLKIKRVTAYYGSGYMDIVFPPNLTKLNSRGFQFDRKSLPKNLLDYDTNASIPTCEYGLLPRNLIRLTFKVCRDASSEFFVQQFKKLPPNLTYLVLNEWHPNNTLLKVLPQSLVYLGASCFFKNEDFIESLPKSLTCLKTYNRNEYIDALKSKKFD